MEITSTASSATCPGVNGPMPDIKGSETIPKDIDVVMIVGSNVSHPPMVACCHPNKVQLLDSCFLWCKIPGGDYYTNTNKTGAPKLETVDDIYGNFSSCLKLYGFNKPEESDGGSGGTEEYGGAVQWNIPSASMASSSGRGTTTRLASLSTAGLLLGVWGLAMFGGSDLLL
ncbi:hypothetical protein V8F33_008036 [Rhypophila sp. PSN 637]